MQDTSATRRQCQAGVLARARKPGRPDSLAKPLTLAAMSLGYGVVPLDVTIVNTALQSIGSALGGGVSELQQVLSTYTVAFAALKKCPMTLPCPGTGRRGQGLVKFVQLQGSFGE
jgi:DHA2 family methylenomycin A resistance protein-like MFS transporter